jgi:hypothetical protein
VIPDTADIEKASPTCILYGLNYKFEKEIDTEMSSLTEAELKDVMELDLLFAFCCEFAISFKN